MSNSKRKQNRKTSSTTVPTKNTVVIDEDTVLYKYVLELAQEKYEYEHQREQDLIQQSGQMQAAFSFMTAALFMALPIALEHRGQLPKQFFFVSVCAICFFLLVSLILASVATWRWKKVALGNITAIKNNVFDSKNKKQYLNEENRIKAKIGMLEESQVRNEKLNNRRALLIHFSLIFFFVAIGSLVASFIVAMIISMN